MATVKERQEQFRQRRLADGSRRECFWLDASAQDALAQLRSLHPGTTRDQTVNQALTGLLAHNHAKPLDANSVKPLEHNEKLLLANGFLLETNRKMPADRAELAAIARNWRGEGMTLEEVATRLNEAGWTPSAIPAKRTTGDAWTAKTVSQLLNRDCKAD